MTQTVTEPEALGLVARRPVESDRRRALVKLTDEGRIVLEHDRRQRAGWLAEAIDDDLSDDDQAVPSDAVVLLRRLTEG